MTAQREPLARRGFVDSLRRALDSSTPLKDEIVRLRGTIGFWQDCNKRNIEMNDRLRERITELAQRVEDDRREPDKILCHVQSLRRIGR